MPKGIYKTTARLKDEKHPFWKGDKVKRVALHQWLTRRVGKPKKCSDCGTSKAKIFHWANISREYKRDINDFKGLCPKCHKKFDSHFVARGSRQGSARLNEKEVLKIRKLHKTKKYFQYELAKEYDVCQRTICMIVNRITWRHI